MNTISKRQCAHIYIYTKSKKRYNTFYIKKAKHLQKTRQFPLRFIYRNPDTVCYMVFMNILKLSFIYQNFDTLRYVTFLYTKSQTLHKKQDNLWYVLYTKILTLCVTQFLMEFLKLAEGRRGLYAEKI